MPPVGTGRARFETRYLSMRSLGDADSGIHNVIITTFLVRAKAAIFVI